MSIYTKQNEDGMLLLNKTKSCLYSKAKAVSTVWTCLITLITCTFIILTYFFDNKILNAFSILFGILFFGLTFVVNKYVSNIKWLAAGIQQKFDEQVFGLDMTISTYRLLGLETPPRDKIIKYASRYQNKKVSNVENWYNDYSNLSKSNQILCCQKENFRWDSNLKNIVLNVYIVSLSALLLAILLVGIFTNNVFNMFCLYSWVLPISQNIFYSFKYLTDDKKRLKVIKQQIDYAESVKSNEEQLFQEVCNLQVLIFEHRIKGFLVPDFIYKLSWKRFQSDEQAIAKDINGIKE